MSVVQLKVTNISSPDNAGKEKLNQQKSSIIYFNQDKSSSISTRWLEAVLLKAWLGEKTFPTPSSTAVHWCNPCEFLLIYCNVLMRTTSMHYNISNCSSTCTLTASTARVTSDTFLKRQSSYTDYTQLFFQLRHGRFRVILHEDGAILDPEYFI